MPIPRLIRSLKRLSMVVAALAGGLLMTSGPAIAASPAVGTAVASWSCCAYINSNSGGANVRGCPDVSCTSYGYYPNGTAVVMTCWYDTGTVVYPPNSNYPSNRWFRISSPRYGYIHSSLIANQASVPKCPEAP